MLLAGHRLVLEVKPETRSNEQNKRLWAMLTDISRQVDWYGQKLSPEDWKNVLTAAYRNETGRVAQGFDGGMVFLGHKTSKFSKKEWPIWMEYLNWASAEKGVKIPASKSMLRSLGIDDD
jgi:hypothetical protein